MLIFYNSKNLFELIAVFQETQRLQQEPVTGIEAVPDESNARYFHINVAGPKDVSKGVKA